MEMKVDERRKERTLELRLERWRVTSEVQNTSASYEVRMLAMHASLSYRYYQVSKLLVCNHREDCGHGTVSLCRATT